MAKLNKTNMGRVETSVISRAMRKLADDIETDDGAANAACVRRFLCRSGFDCYNAFTKEVRL